MPSDCNFADFAGVEHERTARFRITHAGSFLGERDSRPFLSAPNALTASWLQDVTNRVVGRLLRLNGASAVRSGVEELAELLGTLA